MWLVNISMDDHTLYLWPELISMAVAHVFRLFLNQISTNFHEILLTSYHIPTLFLYIRENFVKLYAFSTMISTMERNYSKLFKS